VGDGAVDPKSAAYVGEAWSSFAADVAFVIWSPLGRRPRKPRVVVDLLGRHPIGVGGAVASGGTAPGGETGVDGATARWLVAALPTWAVPFVSETLLLFLFAFFMIISFCRRNFR
jgi:hypothetical protein